MKKGNIITILAIILIAVLGAYWYFFMYSGSPEQTNTDPSQNGFNPFNRPTNGTGGTGVNTNNNNNGNSTSTIPVTNIKIPTLRLLSNTPVGGYGASTTETVVTKATKLASSTQVLGTTYIRWVDRGRGDVYEARGNTLDIITLSNTVVPKIYESIWSKNLTSFVALTLSDQNNTINGIFAELKNRSIVKNSATTSSQTTNAPSITTYELKGKKLPENIIAYAVSPKKDRIFTMINDNETGVGYVSNFNGTSPVQIFTTPLTKVNIEWPSDNIIAITTKGSSDQSGFLYFVDPKTGVWNKILGPLPGLSTKVSTDAKYVFVSVAGNNNNLVTSVYNVSTRKGTDGVIRTLADKCTWGNFYKDIVYCAVPSQPIKAIYPDDWYKGVISFADKIWQFNATTGEIKLISSIVDTSDRVIDAFNLGLDQKDDFLIFMNKNDLSLWSLDLVSGN